MARQEDSDMKIVPDGAVEMPEPAEDSVEAMARLLDREKKNGNLSKARRLGARMAEEVASVEGYSTAAGGPAEKSVPAASAPDPDGVCRGGRAGCFPAQ